MKLITFDVYTALFDVVGSLTPWMAAALSEAGGDGLAEAPTLVRAWRRKQLEYALISNSLGRARVPFRMITARALDYTLAQARRPLGTAERERLAAAWDQLDLWPEAGEVLLAVKARGWRLGLLSNGDSDMLAALAARLPVAMDDILASETAGCYKPDPRVYMLPGRALGLAPAEWLHVAGSATDVMGCKAAGMRCAWSNRWHDGLLDPALGPDYEFSDLRGVLRVI